MPMMPSNGTDPSGHDIERVIEQAKVARARFFFDNPAWGWKAIGWNGLAFGAVLLLAIGAGSGRNQAIESTSVIERLATTLARADTVPPGTVREIAQLLRRPDYDCRQLACEPLLERRNAAARARLQAILAKHSSVATVADR
jgi:hypothetical protein